MNFVAPVGSGYEDLNNWSAVTRIQYGGTAFLLTGDAEALSEEELVKDLQNVRRSGRLIFIFGHEPAVSPFAAGGPDTPASLPGGPGTTWNSSAEDRAFAELMAANKVAAVFARHVHLYNELNYRGMRQFISAGAGAEPYAAPEKGGLFPLLAGAGERCPFFGRGMPSVVVSF